MKYFVQLGQGVDVAAMVPKLAWHCAVAQCTVPLYWLVVYMVVEVMFPRLVWWLVW